MLLPVVLRASYKITTSQLITVENLLGSNLPLFDPEIQVINRTSSTSSILVEGEVRNLFQNQPDPDFDGTVTYDPFIAFSLAEDQSQFLSGLPNTLTGGSLNIATDITITRSSGAAEALVTLVIRGRIESSISPDAGTVINV